MKDQEKDKLKNIQEHILFLGNRNDVYRFYNAMDVFVLPSRVEGFGLAALEAQFCGVKIIISDAVKDEAIIVKKYDKINSFKIKDWVKKIISKQNYNNEYTVDINKFDIQYQAENLVSYYFKITNFG